MGRKSVWNAQSKQRLAPDAREGQSQDIGKAHPRNCIVPLHPPRASILSSGTEITQGLYADTNAMNLSRLLTDRGFEVVGHAAVPDDEALIERAIRQTFGMADLVVMTGGLGPTEDDLTREVLARVWESPLRRVHRATAMMRARFARRGRPMPESNMKQADVPMCGEALLNFWGTAPGILMPAGGGRPWLLAMPGVPSEWKAMAERHLPRVARRFALPAVARHSFHIALVPESTVNGWIEGLFSADANCRVGILASQGTIRVRVLAYGADEAEAAARRDALAARLAERIPGDVVYAKGLADAVALEQAAVEALVAGGRTVALAESCTGGGVARRLTDVPGSSATVLEGAVTYANEAKMRLPGFDAGIIDRHGAVSEEAARAMAEGIRRRASADVGIGITGIAGPGGGTAEKPVGTVWFAVADANATVAIRRLFPGDRDMVRRWSENQALDLLRRWAAGLPLDSLR